MEGGNFIGRLPCEFESIIGDFNRQGKVRLVPRVQDFIGDVREPRRARPDRLHDRQRLRETLVRRMGRVPQGVQYKGVRSLQRRQGLGREFLAVGDVGGQLPPVPLEEEADGLDLPVAHRQRDHPRVSEDEGPVDLVGLGLDVAGIAVLAVEGEGEHPPQVGKRVLPRVNREHGVGPHRKAAQVVEAGHVVHVGVGVNNGVEVPDARAEALGAEIRAGVDHPVGLRGVDVDRRAQARVAWILGSADRALAADDGDADRGAGAEEGDREFGHAGNGIEMRGRGHIV